jgi:catechol 2,3-dioxygenase-like lactoylglutathione lyase family enzyme
MNERVSENPVKSILIDSGPHAIAGHVVATLLAHALGDKALVMCPGLALTALPVAARDMLIANGLHFAPPPAAVAHSPTSGSVDVAVALNKPCAAPIAQPYSRLVDWSILPPRGAVAEALEHGDNDALNTLVQQVRGRVAIFEALFDLPEAVPSQEFHGSVRTHNLAASTRFYAWLLDCWPKEWTHRYATFIRDDLGVNFVLLVSDDMELHHDTLYHLGIGVADRAAVIEAYHRAVKLGASVSKPPRTTWRGTPLHELWLQDPDGNLVEIYARLTAAELAEMPQDLAPVFLVPGT